MSTGYRVSGAVVTMVGGEKPRRRSSIQRYRASLVKLKAWGAT
jgi:hypothetical protein